MLLKNFIKPTNDTVNITATLQDVVTKMTQENLHHIIIINDSKPVGIITERDFVALFKNKIDFDLPAIDYAIKDIITLHHTRLVKYALSMMLHNNIRKIIVIDNFENYVGCIEQEELIYHLEKEIQEKEVQLSQLTHPGNKAVLIEETTTLKSALTIMTERNLTSLLVTSNDTAVGIISESDIIKLAQNHISQNEIVKSFMHSPIVTIEENKTAEDMIQLMQKKAIRRVVIFNSQDKQYYTLTSKDIASTIKGNYTNFIESKFFDTRDTFNALSEYVIELIDIDAEQIVFWTNSITKSALNIHLDDCITKLIKKATWDKILKKLKENSTVFDTITINNRNYQLKGHYSSIGNENIIKLFLNDITELTNLTQQLQKENKIKDKLLYDQAKMVQMGEMISNIAHQWRQPLSTITTAASGLQLQKEYGCLNDEFLHKTLEEIQTQALYLSSTIDTFRNFLKEKKESKEVILQDRIEIALKIVNTSLKNNHIKLIKNIDTIKPIKIKLILGELSQVIINIINNAKDVLKENKIEDPWIKIDLEKNDTAFVITIEDNAGGIPKDVMPHIFKPYFTTKQNNQGTGLGLDMSYQIITESLNGKLYARNTKNGAKFYIELPNDNEVN